jgi:hypothetical protein
MLPDPIQLRASIALRLALALFVFAAFLTGAAPAGRAQELLARGAAPVRLTSPIDERNLVPLEGNVRRDLTADRDLGPVEDSMPLHLYMVLQRTPEQQADLDYLLARQQERTAPEYHKWLTPAQFGARFGAHPQDIAALSQWLESHGMQVRGAMNNASILDFEATAGQIREAFHTELHSFDVAGGRYAANVADPRIPAALAPLVAAIHGMVKIPAPRNRAPVSQLAFDKDTNTWRRVHAAPAGQAGADEDRPDWDPGPNYTGRPVSPQDLYTIYNIDKTFTGGNLAQTATVAVVEQSDMAYGTVSSTTHAATGGDLATFRKLFGVPGTLNMHVYHGYGKATCTDPGVVTTDEALATIDAEWANATAPSANLVFMSCDDTTDVGALSSLLAVVDNNLADVVSLSYNISELSATASVYTFLDTVEAEAAAQGQSILVAAGNGGSDEEDAGTTTVATNGINVSAYSSPLVTVVGATDFQDFFDDEVFGGSHSLSNYWSTTNSQYYSDALSYVPESAWNDSCASSLNSLYEPYESEGQLFAPTRWCALHGTADNGTVSGGGGGVSTHYAVPAWQAGISGYAGSYRASPDIASFGSDGRIYGRELLVCDSAVAVAVCTSTATFGAGGGTNWVAPYLAGVAGLLVTHTGGRQGLLNPTLYALAKAQYASSPTSCYANGQAQNDEQTAGLPAASCIFNDVTTGGNDVPCSAGAKDCVLFEVGEPYGLLSVNNTAPVIPNAYASAPGYDQATGIGSLNVTNLIANWDTAFKSATALTASATSITPSESTTLKATVKGSGAAGYVDNPPVATGTVSFKAGTKALGSCTLSGGSCSLAVAGTTLALGANSVTATFSGSSLYPSSTSSVLTVTVGTVSQNPTTLTSPAQGSTFAGPSETFTWAAASGATGYFLQLGSTGVGSDNLLNSAEYNSTTLSATIASLPVTGETIYARIVTDYNGTHVTKDYTFTAAKQAALSSPAQGSTLVGPVVTFAWSAATGSSVKGYFLQLGSTGVGSDNLLNSTEYGATALSVVISDLPANGETIYARIVTDYNGTHVTKDYTFTAAKESALTAPTPGTTLAGATVTFDWSNATGSKLTGYFLYLGTNGVGSTNLLKSSEYPATQTSVTVDNMPTTGVKIYARIFTDYNGANVYQDYTYTAK